MAAIREPIVTASPARFPSTMSHSPVNARAEFESDLADSTNASSVSAGISPSRQCSGMTPGPTVRDETANDSDDSPADGIQGNHAEQQECQHHQGCAALPGAVSPRNGDSGNAD
jgi:hypothetical protein